MTNPNRPGSPPRFAQALLAFMLAGDDRECVTQELDELYQLHCARRGVATARWWYRRQVAVFAVKLMRHGRRRGHHSQTRLTAQTDSVGGANRKFGATVAMLNFMYEMRQSLRRLMRAPVFTVVSVLTIGIGIGAFTSIFGLVEAVLLEPLPYKQPEQLAWVWRDYTWANFPRGWLGGPDIAGLRNQGDVFEHVAAFASGRRNLAGGDGTGPRQVRVVSATAELFDLLGVTPSVGRGFLPGEDDPGADPLTVLSHDFWRSQYDADPSVLGQTIQLNGTPTTIIGVAPEKFRFVQHSSLGEPVGADLYLNLRVDMAARSAGSGSFAGLARIRPHVGPAQLQSALNAAAEESDTFFDNRGLRLWSVGLQEDLVGKARPALLVLVGSAGFLLLILSANLATLLLGRAAVRSRELGIRSALGAGKSRLLSSVFSESIILGGLGGAMGILLAFWGTELVVTLAPENLPRIGDVGMDASVLAVAVIVSLAMSAVAGLAPAFQALKGSVTGALKEGGMRSGDSIKAVRTRSALVAVQVALSLMLLVGAGLVAQAFANLLRQDPGFDPGTTLTFRVPLAGPNYPDRDAAQAFHEQFRSRLAALPGVVAAGAANAVPLTQSTSQTGVTFPGAEGNTGDENRDNPLVDWFRVTDDYFAAAGLRILAGRSFAASDDDSARVAIVDDNLARQFYPNSSPLGRQIAFSDDTLTIVGVVDQARFYSVHEDDLPQVYITFSRFPAFSMSYAVRTAGLDPYTLLGSARGILRELDPEIPMSYIWTLDSIVHDSLGQQRLSLTLIVSFAVGALLLATLGIYGVVANSVVRRRQEMGVRIALGADAARVLRMVLGQGLRLVGVGTVVGLAGAFATARLLNGVMVGVNPANPIVYVAVALVLAAVAAAASYLPARRATRIDPMEALRPE